MECMPSINANSVVPDLSTPTMKRGPAITPPWLPPRHGSRRVHTFLSNAPNPTNMATAMKKMNIPANSWKKPSAAAAP